MPNPSDKKTDNNIDADLDDVTKSLDAADAALATPYLTRGEVASIQRVIAGGSFMQSFSKALGKEESKDDKLYRLQLGEAIKTIAHMDKDEDRYENISVLLKSLKPKPEENNKLNKIDKMIIHELEKVLKMAEDRAVELKANVVQKPKA